MFYEVLSSEVALYFYKSTICPCMEYCCHLWAGAPSCYLELLEKLQKWICRTVGPSLAASLEPLAHCWNVASLSLYYWYYFCRCSSELAQLVPFSFFSLEVHSLFWLKSLKRLNSYFVMRIWAPKPVYHFLKCPGYLAVLPTPLAMLLSPDDSISHKTNSHDFQKHSVVICNQSK